MHSITEHAEPAKRTTVLLVGEYALLRNRFGRLWMTHVGGEGMELSAESEKALERVLHEFFGEHF